MAKTLYTTNRARPDTSTVLAFLTTRVIETNKYVLDKLVNIMNYIRGTRYIPLILSANVSGFLKWGVGVSYAVHPNMWVHTGGVLSMGRVFSILTSTKHKLNTCSSTESEIVGIHDSMPNVCWKSYFIGYQGYQVTGNIIYQDNKSDILLEKNGKSSSSKCTKYTNIRFFFITDCISKKEFNVYWCPKNYIMGDFMTNPTQGSLFNNFRDQYYVNIWSLKPGGIKGTQECVGNQTYTE